MNRFATLIAWAQGWLNHVGLPAVASFIAGIIHDELPVAEALVAKIVGSIPQDLAASKPLVALGAVLQAAGTQAAQDGIKIGIASLAVASTNAVNELAGKTPVTEVNAEGAINAVEDDAARQIAAIRAEADAKKKALTDAAAAAAADLRAQVSN